MRNKKLCCDLTMAIVTAHMSLCITLYIGIYAPEWRSVSMLVYTIVLWSIGLWEWIFSLQICWTQYWRHLCFSHGTKPVQMGEVSEMLGVSDALSLSAVYIAGVYILVWLVKACKSHGCKGVWGHAPPEKSTCSEITSGDFWDCFFRTYKLFVARQTDSNTKAFCRPFKELLH